MEKRANCTTIFMVPPFGVGKERLYSNGFKGAYLGDVHKPDIKYQRGIYFLFQPEDMMAFEDFLYEEREREMPIVEDYDYENGHVVVIYVLDEKFERDYEKFLKGEYSKFSREFKNSIPRMVNVLGNFGAEREEVSLQHRIMEKDPSLKEYQEETFDIDIGEGEIWSKPNTDEKSDEYLDMDKIKIKRNVNK